MSDYPIPDIPLEDEFNDVLAKTLKGLDIAPRLLAEQTGLEADCLKAVLGGEFDGEIVRRAAGPLRLGAEALLRLGRREWKPKPAGPLPGFAMANTVFGDMTVNAYVAWDVDSREALVFDSGADAGPLLEVIHKEKLRVVEILLTHTHRDHVADLDRLVGETGVTPRAHTKEDFSGAEPFREGERFAAGKLSVETRATTGHARGGVTFVISGLARRVAVVGDAVFAGSMGGGMVSFEEALRTNRQAIFTLPDDTILAPGHGPLTTVGEEKANNPFFPEFQS